MSLPAGTPVPLDGDDTLGLAMNRAIGGAPIPGNAVAHLHDSPRALDEMIAIIARARRRIHLENYIIRCDTTGRRFAEALAERAAAGVQVRVLYDALGSIGTRWSYWRGLRQKGIEVRPFHPLLTTSPIDLFSRNHRKLLVVDGEIAMLGGICLGDEWAGDRATGRPAWRDSVVRVDGPAAAAMDQTFGRVWALAGPPLPSDELVGTVSARGTEAVRVVDGIPGRTRIYRVAQLTYDTALERIWIWDAYLAAPPPLSTALLDAARGGVDVRVMVPSTSDLRVVRDITRFGYRDLLLAGARVFEWRGPMLHAKAMILDRRWARIGSTNLNLSSLYANHELDVIIESETFVEEMANQFRKDMLQSNEIVLRPGRYLRRGRLVDADAPPAEHPAPSSSPMTTRRRNRFDRQMATVMTLRRLAGGMRRRFTVTAAGLFAIMGLLLVAFPVATGLVLAAVSFAIAGTIAFASLRAPALDDRRRVPRPPNSA